MKFTMENTLEKWKMKKRKTEKWNMEKCKMEKCKMEKCEMKKWTTIPPQARDISILEKMI